jgi:hypothetical protein
MELRHPTFGDRRSRWNSWGRWRLRLDRDFGGGAHRCKKSVAQRLACSSKARRPMSYSRWLTTARGPASERLGHIGTWVKNGTLSSLAFFPANQDCSWAQPGPTCHSESSEESGQARERLHYAQDDVYEQSGRLDSMRRFGGLARLSPPSWSFRL